MCESAAQSVMGAFARQNRPAAAFPPTVEGAAIGLLSIAILIVAPPARRLRQNAFEHLIDHREGIEHQRVVRSPNSQPDKLEKIAAHNVACRMLATAVGDNHLSLIRVRRSYGLFRIGRRDANVVT